MSVRELGFTSIIHDKTRLHYLRWYMLFITMLCYLFYYTGRQNFSFAIVGMQNDLGFTATHTGTISGVMLLFYGLGQILSGYLGDRYSPKNIVVIGALLSIAMNFLMSTSSAFSIILLLWCVNGIAQSMGFAPGSKIIANWWLKDKKGFAMGLFLCSSGASSVITSGLCLLVLQHYSWPWVFRLPLLPFLLVALLFYTQVKDSPHEVRVEKKDSKNLQLSPKEIYRRLSNKNFISAGLSMAF